MILFLYGKDTFRLHQQLHKMMQKFQTEKDPAQMNLIRLDANKETAGRIWEEIQAFPFLAEKKMIVIEGLIESKLEGLKAEMTQKLKNKTFPEHNVVVLCEYTEVFKKKADKELFDVLCQEKYAQQFDFLLESKLSSWVQSEVSARGGVIDARAVDYLVQNIGSDMWQLNALIDQLLAYRLDLLDSKITKTDVALFLDEMGDNNIFNTVDAIVGKQTEQAFAHLRQQYAAGQEVLYLVAMILRQFRILLELKDLTMREEGVSSDVLAKKLKIHPFVVKKALPLLRKYSLSDLRQVHQELLDIDKQIKLGGGNDRVLLDVFVGRLVTRVG